MNAAIPPQVSKLIPLLGSDKEGEVVAAARAICRMLGTAGMDLHDLVKAVDRPKPQRRHPRTESSSWQAPHGRLNPHADRAEWCRLNGNGLLTTREEQFITDLVPRLRRYGGALSPRQAEWLADIYARLRARENAA